MREEGESIPCELSAAGLIVPEPSLTPSPFAVWAEYIADGAMQQRRTLQLCAAQKKRVFPNQRVCAGERKRLQEDDRLSSVSVVLKPA